MYKKRETIVAHFQYFIKIGISVDLRGHRGDLWDGDKYSSVAKIGDGKYFGKRVAGMLPPLIHHPVDIPNLHKLTLNYMSFN
jgi:hypothetical protein